MTHRGQITDKWTRVCVGCGERYHINALKRMDGNECCPGEKFTRDRTKVVNEVIEADIDGRVSESENNDND